MKRLSLLSYFLLITLVTIIMLLVYATVQQSYRTAANDPQIQITEDIKSKIEQRKPVENNFTGDTIDISQSLATVVTLYNAAGKPLRSTGYLNGMMLQLPQGVFDFAKKEGVNRVTWQPNHEVRMAMVIVHVNSSPVEFVASGRSLKEVEEREYELRKMVFIAWMISIGIILLSAGIEYYKIQRIK